MQALFVFSLMLLFYIYIGYPIIAALLAKLNPQLVGKRPAQPDVTIVIAAHNEARVIAATIENKLQLDYPAAKIEIIVVSDGSIDGTDAIVQQYAGQGVRLIRQEPRQGKTAAVNRALSEARGEIIVFSDANSIYDRAALQRIVENFSDASVGYVTGKMIYVNADGSMVGDGCSAYMKYENILRSIETDLGSVVGVDGGIDAVRRQLYVPMNADQLPDFVEPLHVVTQGYRVVYEPAALLREDALGQSSSEYRMRVRVGLRALWALADMRHLLNPLRYPLFSWQLWSHKVLRYLAFVPLIALIIANIALLDQPLFFVVAVAHLAFYIFAALGYIRRERAHNPIYFSLPYYFLLINLACAHATWRFIKGEKQVLWTPRAG